MTEVNEAIEKSALHNPERFWYLNNGITILCNKVDKQVYNGDARDFGIFDCEGVSIVNGAQTVGVVWELSRRDPVLLSGADARVHVRMISLEHCPEGFQIEVTRATNTQNRIQSRDFAALDPVQQRLSVEMELDGLRYAYKSGDLDPQNGEGCNIEDATVALVCASNDVALVVLAKRNIGMLWQEIDKPPYTTLFNEQLSAPKMWRAVLVSREVSRRLAAIDKSVLPRGDWLAIHGNRFIIHRIFRDPGVAKYADTRVPVEELLASVRTATDEALPTIAALIEELHPNAYLANLFKNTQKCKNLDWHLNNPGKTKDPEPESEPQQYRTSLFDFEPISTSEDSHEEADE